jgi:uncharacterized damage-inducible protein DinB
MSTELIQKLFQHVWWADAEVGSALAGMEQVPAGALRLYAHVLAAELVWIDRIERHEQTVAVWPDADLDGCTKMATRARARYRAYLASLTVDALAHRVPYTNTAGTYYETPLEDILLHVALHGAYHRGQIASVLREGGLTPPATDYAVFARS